MISIRRAMAVRRQGPTLGSKIPGPPPGGFAPDKDISYSRPLYREAPRAAPGLSLLSFFFWTTFLVSTAITYLWVFNQTDVAALQLLEARDLIEELENVNRDLQVAIDELSQIDRITRIARQELGMVMPAAESLFVYLPEMTR